MSAFAAIASQGLATCPAGSATSVVDASGLAVAPGFINMLSWSTESLLVDGRSQGEMRAGRHHADLGRRQVDGPAQRRDEAACRSSRWATSSTTLPGRRSSEYLRTWKGAASHRTSPRSSAPRPSASTSSASTTGSRRRQQLDQMRALVRQEMEAGALGIGSSLIYAPAFYASTEELIELCKVAARYRGKYISHMRSEGNRLIEAVDELIRISREARRPGRDLSPQGRRAGELGEDGSGDREGRSGAQGGTADHRGHVHVHGRAQRASTPRCRRGCWTAATTRSTSGSRIRTCGRRSPPRFERRPTRGRTCIAPPDLRIACCWSDSSPRR